MDMREQLAPLKWRPGEVFNFENREFYDVSAIIRDINANSKAFEFGTIAIERLMPQVEGSGGIEYAHVDSLGREEASAPVIMIRYDNGSVRLIDGHHRLLKARQFDATLVGAYLLSAEQTKKYRMSGKSVPKI